MTRKLLLTLSLSLLATFAQADDARHRALAEEILTITRAASVMDNLTSNIEGAFHQGMQRMNLPADKKTVVDQYSARLSKLLNDQLDWPEMKTQLVDQYVQTFNEQELEQLVDFYKSPLGQKMIVKMPELMQQAMQIGQKQVREVLPQVQQLTQQMMTELQAGSGNAKP